jgi:hypothetical protein
METENVRVNLKLIHILNKDDQSVSDDGRRSTGDTALCVEEAVQGRPRTDLSLLR